MFLLYCGQDHRTAVNIYKKQHKQVYAVLESRVCLLHRKETIFFELAYVASYAGLLFFGLLWYVAGTHLFMYALVQVYKKRHCYFTICSRCYIVMLSGCLFAMWLSAHEATCILTNVAIQQGALS